MTLLAPNGAACYNPLPLTTTLTTKLQCIKAGHSGSQKAFIVTSS